MKPTLHATALALSLAFAFATVHAQDSASITQNGTNSTAAITQAGNHGANDATIVQARDVDASSAAISQSNVGNSSATISQAPFGSGLDAAIEQRDSESVTASITQQGPGFKASVLQAGAFQSDVTIGQFGDVRGDGEANVTVLDSQGTSVLINSGAGARVQATQSNVVNGSIQVTSGIIGPFASINQHDASNVAAKLDQAGPVEANIEQAGDGGTVDVSQNGNLDVANVFQDGAAAGPGAGSLVSITQEASFNTANVTQVGRGFTATITQTTGDGNTATIKQHY